MTSKDIRTLYDIASKGGGLQANAILQTRPPCSNVDAAGFNCLTVVVRRIYSHCMFEEGYDASPGWLKKSEGSNPILSHAWHKFGQTSAEVAEGEEDRKRAFAKLRDLTLDPYSSFEDLCHSKLMNRTLWAQNVFRLVDHLHGLNTGNEVKVKPDVIAQMSLLELDHVKSPEMTLDDAVNRAFGAINLHEPVISRPVRPWAVRVLYHSHGEEERRLGLKDLRYLQLPVWKEDVESSELCFHQVGKAFYSLMVIVRLRDEVHSNDFVRTYSPHGCNIVSEYEPLAFMESKWRLTDPSARYMLFYGDVKGEPEPEEEYPTLLHEVAMPERVHSEDIDALNKHLGNFKPFSAKPSGGPSNTQQKGHQGLQTPQKRPAPASSQAGSQEQENPQGEREPPRKRKRNRAKNKGNPQNSQDTQPPPHESELRRDARRN